MNSLFTGTNYITLEDFMKRVDERVDEIASLLPKNFMDISNVIEFAITDAAFGALYENCLASLKEYAAALQKQKGEASDNSGKSN